MVPVLVGGPVVTATPRLARHLLRQHNSRMLSDGKRAWETPDVLPWHQWMLREYRRQHPEQTLWNAWQEQALWEQAIAGDPASPDLIETESAARLARDAWYLVHAWGVPFAGAQYDSSPFARWAARYQQSARERMDAARAGAHIDTAPEVSLAGFDYLTPLQQRVCGDAYPVAGISHAARAVRAAFPNAGSEIEAAAEWASQRARENPGASIGVVVVGLQRLRARVENAFHAAAGGLFHLSLGPPLARQPIVAAALSVLALSRGTLRLSEWTRLLLSPYSDGSWQLDLALRRDGLEEAPIAAVGDHRACPARLRHRLEDCRGRVLSWPRQQQPGFYAAEWTRLLEDYGWPGGVVLESAEFQAREAFKEALGMFATLDDARLTLTPAAALARLKHYLAARPFQVEDRGEPIQVMSVEEAAGLDFDHLWIAGLDDANWPPPAAPNPLVPIMLQRSRGIPESSPAGMLSWAKQVTSRLLTAAPGVICSHAESQGEQPLHVSPLIAHLEPAKAATRGTGTRTVAASLAGFTDEAAPPLAKGTRQRGGARALQLQAACPFRAFAELRLRAAPIETPAEGFDPRRRGSHLHKALEHYWHTHDIVEAAGKAVADLPETTPFQAKRKALEQKRLERLIEGWLELEARRETEYEVLPPEQENEVELGGLRFRTRIDRMDRLAGGEVLLIDYKSTAPAASAWDGDRPAEPQVPLYAITAEHPLAGAVFAQVKPGEMRFSGLLTRAKLVPGPRPVEPREFAATRAEWRRVLEALAVRLREGAAEVDPKKGDETCQLCHLRTLCRIHEPAG